MSANPILQLAILKGLLDPNILPSTETDTDPVASLIRQGLLDPLEVEKLQQELSLDGSETMSGMIQTRDSHTGSIPVFGRYVQLEFLGQGGMARVYKAYDPSLSRTVALKLVRADDPQFAHQLLLEARSQARIEHEHVCKIYETGEVDGTPYIAMQFISGQTLKEMKDGLSLKQKVQLIKQVADGVHAAHKAGLIHRDLKPGNILIEKRESGPFAYVMDFGLAHESKTSVTTGHVVGTPSYMSPEQAKGEKEKLNESSDTYSIGATLYEIVTGQPPFDGSSSDEILKQVLEHDPVPPRNIDSTLPPDLQTIILKCLEKNRQSRYESARSLSEDLSRFLDGDPILAKRATWNYRIGKKIRKHPVASGLVAAAVVAVIVFGAIAGVVQWRAKKQARLFQEFGQEVTRIEAIMRYGYLLPLHDVQQEKGQVFRRLGGIKNRMNDLGSMAYGPGYYSLGRGYLSLHRYQDAYDHLIQASEKYNYREPEVENAIGLALAMLYQEKLREAEQIYSKDQIQLKKSELKKQYRDPALQYIQDAPSESSDYVDALIAFLEEDYEKGLKKSQEAIKKAGWLYEGHLVQGNIFTALGNEYVASGKNADGEKYFEQARQAYLDASKKGQSDPQVYEGLCALHSIIQEMLVHWKGTSSAVVAEEGIGYCEKALQADSKSISANLLASDISNQLSYDQAINGKESSTASERAAAYAQAALKIDPQSGSAYRRLGNVYYNRASAELYSGGNPVPFLDLANHNFEKASIKMPEDSDLLSLMGNNLVSRARYEIEWGKDPGTTLQKAMKNLQRAAERNPKNFKAYSNLGTAYYTKGAYEYDAGLDPRKSLEEAIRLFKKSIEINPSYANPYEYMGVANLSMASYLADLGVDAVPSLNESISAYTKCLSLAPDDAFSYAGLGIAEMKKADLLQRKGENPDKELKSSREAFQKSIDLNNQIVQTYAYFAEAELVAARKAIAIHESPEPLFQNARRILSAGTKISAECADCLAVLTSLHVVRAEYLESLRKPVANEIQLGIAAADRGLKQKPLMSNTHALRGKLLLLRARSSSGPARKAAAHESAASFNKAFKIKPLLKNQYGDEWKEAQLLTGS